MQEAVALSHGRLLYFDHPLMRVKRVHFCMMTFLHRGEKKSSLCLTSLQVVCMVGSRPFQGEARADSTREPPRSEVLDPIP